MHIWILIITLSHGVDHIEFSSKVRCEQAKAAVIDEHEGYYLSAICVEK